MFAFSRFFRSHGLKYSTISSIDAAAAASRKPNLIVDYLIDSLRFSKQDAISVSSKCKVTHLKSSINSDLVVNLFKNYGLDISQIREIVSSAPKILNCKANKTLEPKLRVFQDLGLSGSDLVNLIRKNPDMFGYGLHTRIMPGLALLRKLVGSDENVVEVINRSRWLYVTNFAMKRLSANVSLLKNYGVLDDRIVKFVLNNPEKLMVEPDLLETRLLYVEHKLGIPRESPNFIYAISVVIWCTDLEIEKKMQIFRSFGWSNSEMSLLFRAQPYCLNKSTANISVKLRFYMNDLGYTPSYLTRCNSFFTFSLEKRVIPRHTILKILKEKNIVNDKPSLITIVSYSESKFLDFLRGFESDIPRLSETYMNIITRVIRS